MGRKSKAAAAAETKDSKTAAQPVEQVADIEQPDNGEQSDNGDQPDNGEQLGDSDTDGASADVAPTKRVRFLVSISGHDFNAVPGQVIELSDDQAIAFADGERAELVDAPVED